MILIFTNKQDTHPTHVIQKLTSWGVPVFRLNTECLLVDYQFSWWCNSDGCDFWLKNVKNGLTLYGHEITAIWDRRAMIPRKLPFIHNERAVNKYNREEAHGFLSFLRYYLKDIYSIGSIVQDRPAESKMLQLSLAEKVGFNVPETVFSNNKDSFRSLCAKFPHLSIKSINNDCMFLDGEQEYVFYSKKADSERVLSQPDNAFGQTVSFLQNYVEKQYELRVTVCCNEVIACKIDSQLQEDNTGKIDWREGYEHGLKHEIIELPDKIKSKCIEYLKLLNLNFGCFDFIVTPDNNYVFLECNPNGQWMWIEILTGFDISEIIAKHLAKFEVIKQR